MGKDMTVPCDEGLINVRVGAIILKDEEGKKVFAGHKMKKADLNRVK